MVEVKTKKEHKYWLVSPELYAELDKEFNFDCDPCPYPCEKDGINKTWGMSNWVNPPFKRKDYKFNRKMTDFVKKAIVEQQKGKTTVFILPIFSTYQLLLEAGAEIRALGRIKYVDVNDKTKRAASNNSALFILKGKDDKHST